MDVRLPIGIMFAGAGALLILAGLTTDPTQLKLALAGINLDLVWGGALEGFGLGAIALALTGWRRDD
jgi:hypothetical protein